MRRLYLAVLLAALPVAGYGDEVVRLSNGSAELSWIRDGNGYMLESVMVDGMPSDIPVHQRMALYSEVKPSSEPVPLYGTSGEEVVFPEPKYRYIIATWQQNNTPVALNRAGESLAYRPDSVEVLSDGTIVFRYADDIMEITEKWSADMDYSTDFRVDMTLTAKKEGFWSMASPSLVSVDRTDFSWATVPGIYQGDELNPDYPRALGYGHGIPDRPVVSKERTASTLTSIISDRKGVTVAVTAEPGTGRDPWEYDSRTHAVWRLGLSLMNRDGEFTPTLYHPVLGEAGSYLRPGDKVSFSFRYTLQKADWYTVMKHAVNDIYRFADFLRLKETSISLTQRLYDMHSYLVNDSTSMWRNCVYKGVTIGAQDYLGGVYGSEKDAMKNSDYGAMWMLASITDDPRLTESRLPYALNFKKMQQNTGNGFLYGSSAGQYYLYRSSRFTEEWGPYTEPVATTYYMMMDLGNILLFEPDREDLKENLRHAADCLLRWMKPDGSWEVAYDNSDFQPLFTDLKDLRPTFYGLLIAYRILGDSKYLDAAVAGADWYVGNAVKKGRFIGVCGDTRFAPDFAAAQAVQALLEMEEATGNEEYRDAAIYAAEIYTGSVYTHPVPTDAVKIVKGREHRDWEIAQAGLNFEHGGVLGSANHRGPILLASHAGMFVRIFSMTGDSLFLNMARAAAIGRDAFVDKKTGVASYYWDSMDNGAGPYPHHAWWQVGWITDYLMAEAELRSGGMVSFPKGFITPKVGPHRCYGFAPGRIYGSEAELILIQGLLYVDNPYFEYITAIDRKERTLYVILMNNDDEARTCRIAVEADSIPAENASIRGICIRDASGDTECDITGSDFSAGVPGYGMKLLEIKY